MEKAGYDGLAACFQDDCRRPDLWTVDKGRNTAVRGARALERESVRGTERVNARTDSILDGERN